MVSKGSVRTTARRRIGTTSESLPPSSVDYGVTSFGEDGGVGGA
jgi:hypothetical protein